MKGGDRVKKQVLTRQDIQKVLLARINKGKVAAIIISVLIIICVILYPIHLINYLNGTPYDYTDSRSIIDFSPTAVMIIFPILMIILIVTLINGYFIDLYKIKKGKFNITEETLWDKEKTTETTPIIYYSYRIRFFSHSQKFNLLHFPYVSVPVEEDVYKYSRKGDRFYVVTLISKGKPKKKNTLAYHMKYYEIKTD